MYFFSKFTGFIRMTWFVEKSNFLANELAKMIIFGCPTDGSKVIEKSLKLCKYFKNSCRYFENFIINGAEYFKNESIFFEFAKVMQQRKKLSNFCLKFQKMTRNLKKCKYFFKWIDLWWFFSYVERRCKNCFLKSVRKFFKINIIVTKIQNLKKNSQTIPALFQLLRCLEYNFRND